ncbi:MAG: alanine--glyoxylate aminotransferase family protein [Halofilum sp. (in: g-proteobacteria)]|nr:alanine--glyoxylate aminotransferase family protein [Halofilum sp. (in: g-proteobacteria)]
MTAHTFRPPVRTLMGPGPSDVHPRVREALGRPTIGHLDPQFVAMMDDVKALLQYALRTENRLTIPISAPGSAGMEAAFVNLVEPGDTVVVCRNGVFGARMQACAERCGATTVVVDDDWGRAVDPDKVAEALRAHPEASVLAFVMAETSTGACSDAETLCRLAHEHGCLSLVDAVTSLAGVPVEVDGWGIDAIYSGSQKCLSCTPGLAPVSFSERALERVRNRTRPVQSWFLDLNLVMGYWGDGAATGKRAYHHTAPVNALYGLHEALVMLSEEGIENAWARHRHMHQALRDGLEAMGLAFVVDPDHRLPQLNAVWAPAGIEEAQVRARLLNEFNLEIGAGLGDFAGRVWRIGLMGYGARRENVLLCLNALEAVLGDMGAPIERGAATAAAQRVLAA